MSTQGIVSVIIADIVTYKVITGSDGYNAPSVAKWIKENSADLSGQKIYDAAIKLNFGSKENLIVQTNNPNEPIIGEKNKDELNPLYLNTSKFENPRFNPRWEQGTSDYIELVYL